MCYVHAYQRCMSCCKFELLGPAVVQSAGVDVALEDTPFFDLLAINRPSIMNIRSQGLVQEIRHMRVNLTLTL